MTYDITEELETVWDALHAYRERCIPENDSGDIDHTDKTYDEQWGDICTSMSRITESLGYEINQDGDYVIVPEEEQNA